MRFNSGFKGLRSDVLTIVNVKFSVLRRSPVVFIRTDVSEEHIASVFSIEEYSTVDILNNIQVVTPRIPRYLIAVTLFHGTRGGASWLSHCATNRKVAGSIPDGVIVICH